MAYFNNNITITLTAVEMATIASALRYAANQVHDSDIPVFESYEYAGENTGVIFRDDDLYAANQAKAGLALELADTLDLIEADSVDWEVLNSVSGGHVTDSISVWCRHHKTDDFSTPLVREFIWSYTPKQSSMPSTVYTSVLKDCVMPLNMQIAVHKVPYNELDDKNVANYFDLDDLMNKTPIITGDEDIDAVILEALRNFVKYHC